MSIWKLVDQYRDDLMRMGPDGTIKRRDEPMSWRYNAGCCSECCGTVMVCGSERPDADYAWHCINETCQNHEGTHTFDLDVPEWIEKFNREKA